MQVSITILVENTTPMPGFHGEYGFSALVEVDGKKFLFDTGSDDALIKNAALAGIDLAQIEDVVISHGHFDHTGALLAVLKSGSNKKIYAHSNIFTPRFVVLGEFKKDIGVPFRAEEIQANGAELVATNTFSEIYPGVFVSGEIPRMSSFEDVGGSFYAEVEGELIPDNIDDDMSMIINHPDGLIIISGCAHAGVVNTIEYARNQTGQNKVLAFIGGTHLLAASEERIARTTEALKEFGAGKIIACHCTGFDAMVQLRNAFGSQLIKGETGMNFKF